jgi:hypothetical protein
MMLLRQRRRVIISPTISLAIALLAIRLLLRLLIRLRIALCIVLLGPMILIMLMLVVVPLRHLARHALDVDGLAIKVMAALGLEDGLRPGHDQSLALVQQVALEAAEIEQAREERAPARDRDDPEAVSFPASAGREW